MQIELNIGLDVNGGFNNALTRDRKVGQVLTTLKAMPLECRRFITSYPGPAGYIMEHGLFVRLNANNLFDLVKDVYSLAGRLEQDCIAVFRPDTWEGILLGPSAHRCGDFFVSHFRRFTIESDRRAA